MKKNTDHSFPPGFPADVYSSARAANSAVHYQCEQCGTKYRNSAVTTEHIVSDHTLVFPERCLLKLF